MQTPISTSPARWITSTWQRNMTASSPMPSGTPKSVSALSRFPATGYTRQLKAGLLSMHSTRSPPMSASLRFRPTKVMTPSCWTNRCCTKPCQALSRAPSAIAGCALMNALPTIGPLRADLQLIGDMIEPNSRVLDVGCGDGALLAYLAQEKSVDARGVELSHEGVKSCVALGLSVIQGDADTDLADYPSEALLTMSCSARPCRRRAARKTCWKRWFGSAATRWCPSSISVTGGRDYRSC